MQRLYLQFYVTILVVLAVFVGAAVLLWRVADDDNRTPQYLDVAAELTGALLPDQGAPKPEQQRAIEAKAPGDLVSDADRAVEVTIRRLLTRHFPDCGVLGEEMGGAATGRPVPGAAGCFRALITRRWMGAPSALRRQCRLLQLSCKPVGAGLAGEGITLLKHPVTMTKIPTKRRHSAS